MSGAHTPGPWVIGDSAKRENCRMIYCDNSGSRVADCSLHDYGINHATAEANAKLIAAAPDLARLLRQAKEMAEFGDINADMEDDGVGWKQWYIDTAAALAKAGV